MLAQLRTVLDLTNTEIQVAETRLSQARTDAVRRELSQNAPVRHPVRRSAPWPRIACVGTAARQLAERRRGRAHGVYRAIQPSRRPGHGNIHQADRHAVTVC